MNKILLLGSGYVARHFGARLLAGGAAVSGTTRDAEKAAALGATGTQPVLWTAEGIDAAAVEAADAFLISTPPDDDGCPARRAVDAAFRTRREPIAWVGYLSTNGVYGDHGGAWVHEQSPLRATSLRAGYRIAAERQWRSLADAIGAPLVIFRLPGIYGPGRSAFDTVREGRAQRIYKKGQMFSRAHVADIAAALERSIRNPQAGALFNIADDEPAPPQDVIAYACELLGVAPPPLVSIDDASLSDMARSFYADNKRVSNALMKARLLPALRYPSYREGLAAILAEELAATRIPD